MESEIVKGSAYVWIIYKLSIVVRHHHRHQWDANESALWINESSEKKKEMSGNIVEEAICGIYATAKVE